MAGLTSAQPSPASPGDAPSIEQLAAAFPQLEIIELIGQGGMAFVFKARQLHLDREVALKLLPGPLGADPRFAERFTREARVLAKLNHPNIVMVHDFGSAGGFYYLIMEYVEGLNLRQAMRMGRFSPAEALAIVPKICEALQFAHEQGVLHRDIKPENLLLDTRGRIKIADFGIARIIGDDPGSVTLTGTGAALGTPHYMAPEQLETPSRVDHRADIYSLGVVFYEMLTGELPIGRFEPPSSRATIDNRIDAIVLRALAKERELRQKDAREMQTQVEGLSSPANSAKDPADSRFKFFRNSSSHGQLIWKIAAAALLGVAIFVFARLTAGPAREARSTPPNVTSPSQPAGNSRNPEIERAQNDAIRSARERYENAKTRHAAGEISSRELALANRDLAVAEARDDTVRRAGAQYAYAEWNFREALNSRKDEEIWPAETEVLKAEHALELARAGTNEVSIAQADLKFAERSLGAAHRKMNQGAITPEELKKFENEHFYADMRYKRLKQAASAQNERKP